MADSTLGMRQHGIKPIFSQQQSQEEINGAFKQSLPIFLCMAALTVFLWFCTIIDGIDAIQQPVQGPAFLAFQEYPYIGLDIFSYVGIVQQGFEKRCHGLSLFEEVSRPQASGIVFCLHLSRGMLSAGAGRRRRPLRDCTGHAVPRDRAGGRENRASPAGVREHDRIAGQYT